MPLEGHRTMYAYQRKSSSDSLSPVFFYGQDLSPQKVCWQTCSRSVYTDVPGLAQAKAAVASKAISLNGKKVFHSNTLVEESELLEGRVMVFGHGKSGLRVVEVEQD